VWLLKDWSQSLVNGAYLWIKVTKDLFPLSWNRHQEEVVSQREALQEMRREHMHTQKHLITHQKEITIGQRAHDVTTCKRLMAGMALLKELMANQNWEDIQKYLITHQKELTIGERASDEITWNHLMVCMALHKELMVSQNWVDIQKQFMACQMGEDNAIRKMKDMAIQEKLMVARKMEDMATHKELMVGHKSKGQSLDLMIGLKKEYTAIQVEVVAGLRREPCIIGKLSESFGLSLPYLYTKS
jgi:hypothetical protein